MSSPLLLPRYSSSLWPRVSTADHHQIPGSRSLCEPIIGDRAAALWPKRTRQDAALPGASCIQAHYYGAESGIRHVAVPTADKTRCLRVRAEDTEIGRAQQVMPPPPTRYTRERGGGARPQCGENGRVPRGKPCESAISYGLASITCFVLPGNRERAPSWVTLSARMLWSKPWRRSAR